MECNDSGVDIEEVLARNLERHGETIGDTAFIDRLVKGVLASVTSIDAMIQPIAPEWPIAQIARIDRMIMRMAIYELQSMHDVVPAKVAINEAVELAKAFGSDNSSKFVNGVLGTAYRQLSGGSDDGSATSR